MMPTPDEIRTVLAARGVLTRHRRESCAGAACPIHAPSDHHMRDWPQILRASGLTERQCPHGIGHPDPDSVAWMERVGRSGFGVHGCDGCCSPDGEPC